MPYVPVPKDLNAVKTKVAFNLTKRQLICFSLAASAGVPTYFLTRGIFGNTGAVIALLIAALPFFAFAMYEKNGQPLEKILKNYINAKYRRPKVRPYVTNNIYSAIEKQILLEQEVDRIVGTEKENTAAKGKAAHGKAAQANSRRGKKG
jgi:hypothetical protein